MLRLFIFSFFTGWMTAITALSAHASVQALRITDDNAPSLVQGGPDAAGGVGDWFLGNGTLCAVISGLEHENEFSPRGGVLTDLGFCDRDDDRYVTAQDLINGSRSSPVEIESIDRAVGEDTASVLTIGGRGGVMVETRYTVREEAPTRLFISKKIRLADTDATGFGVYAPVAFNYRSMESFVLSSQELARSNGFVQEEFVTRGPTAFDVAARPADTIITISEPGARVPVAYGWRLLSAKKTAQDGASVDVPTYVLADGASNALLVLTDPFALGKSGSPGLVQLLQVALMELEPGEVLHLEEELILGRRGDVASVTDQLFADAPVLKGKVTEADAVLHLDLEDGTPFTHIHPARDGTFSAHAPAGTYTLRARAAGRGEIRQSVTLTESGGEAGTLRFDPPARILLPRGEAMRLVFKGGAGTLDPDFEDPMTGFVVRDDKGPRRRPAVSSLFLAGVESDRASVDIRPGTYQVYATRGPEYSIETTEITLKAGETRILEIAVPYKVVATPGYMAADMHVHSAASFDSAFSSAERVRTFVAEHGEVMVASEHETVFDFAPLVRELGVQQKIVTITGTEMTSEVSTARIPHTIGHVNFFPLKVQPYAYRRGVPKNENRRLREVLHDMRRRDGEIISQLNHARETDTLSGPGLPSGFRDLINNGSYLDHMGPAGQPFRPEEPLASFPNAVLAEPDPVTGIRDIDVDTMEVMNGSQGYAPTRIAALRRDWLSFLKQGVLITGVANSDSHASHHQVALPRTMVALEADTVAAFDQPAFLKALRQGRAYGTTGPMLTFSLSGTQMGEIHTGTQGVLSGVVQTADWIATGLFLRIQVNGETVYETPVAQDGTFSFDLSFATDSFVMIEVEGKPGDAYKVVYPGYLPYAYTNPVYVDADADGVWSPPGL